MTDAATVLDVDLAGSVRITDALFPLVNPGSSAILIGSIAGYSEVPAAVEPLLDDPLADGFLAAIEQAVGKALDSATAYVLAKRGVTRLAERLATPWGKKGGRTVAISPGLIDTPMGRLELDRQEIIPVMIEVTPVKRPDRPLPGRPEDIAAAVAFLESDAAAFISGCDIRIDGGLVGSGNHLMGVVCSGMTVPLGSTRRSVKACADSPISTSRPTHFRPCAADRCSSRSRHPTSSASS